MRFTVAMEPEQQQARLRDLVLHGKKQGFVTLAEINDYLLDEVSSEAEQEQFQIEEVVLMLSEMAIPVYEVPPDLETLLSSGGTESGSEEEGGSSDSGTSGLTINAELGRTTDPVRMYMREMGTVELLTRAGEIVLAKRIEEGVQEVLHAIAQYPENMADVLNEYARYEKQEIRLSDIISGFLDVEEEPIQFNEEMELAADEEENDDVKIVDEDEESDSAEGEEGEEGEEGSGEGEGDAEAELDTGPDPVLAHERFMELDDLYKKFLAAEKKYGRKNKNTDKHAKNLAEAFVKFKLVPRQLDKLNKKMRAMLDEARSHERFIMNLCINKAKMPRKVFIDSFPKSETDLGWLETHLRSKKPYAAV